MVLKTSMVKHERGTRLTEQQWQTPHLDRLEELLAQMVRYVHARLEEEGAISPSQYYLMKMLERSTVLTVSDLATKLGMTAAGATGLIDRLSKAGLAVRRRDEHDRRVVWVELSAEGAASLQEARRLRRQVFGDVFASLSPAELEQMVMLYEKVSSGITKLKEGDQNCG